MEFIDFKNIHDMLSKTVAASPQKPAYRYFIDGNERETVTWEGFYDQVRGAASALMALGVAPGDRVAILSATGYRWVLMDTAIVSIGACTVGIYPSTLANGCRYILEHSGARLVFAENQEQLEKLTTVQEELSHIEKAICFSGGEEDADWGCSFGGFLREGEKIEADAFLKRTEMVKPDDPAGIIYTSGTTGLPKGVVLTHDNFTFTAQSCHGCADFSEATETFLFLPLAHVFARTAVQTAILTGTATTFARSLDTLVDDMRIAAPHWFISVPRIFEKIHAKVLAGAEAKGGLALKMFRRACAIGALMGEHKLRKIPVPLILHIRYALAQRLVFSKLHKAMGGRLQWCISGAAPLNPDIARFFHGAGVLILEGLGMTENTSFSNLNRPNDYRFGWVGPPGPGIEQRLDTDGEIQFWGRNVMKEYYRMEEATKEVFTEDGWLRTGDIGEIDEKNFLRITGRKKELIITAGGKNIAPAAIETVIAASKYIAQVLVIGDRRKYLSALVTPDADAIREYAEAQGISFSDIDSLIQDERIIRLIEMEVKARNAGLASYETVKKVTLVPEFTIANEMITPTLKLKKNIIEDRHAEKIEAMYV